MYYTIPADADLDAIKVVGDFTKWIEYDYDYIFLYIDF